MKIVKLILILLFVFKGVVAMGSEQISINNLMPISIEGWTPGIEDQEYVPENLYEYINGGAELFISYSFEKCFARTYMQNELPDIIVDIFDMGNSYNAFGIFSHSKESIDNKYGQGSETSANTIIFWKDRFFISLMISYEDKNAEKALRKLAKRIDENITKEGVTPTILNYLPQKSLIKESIRYFNHHIWQNTYYFIADSNVLNINKDTETLLAKYKETDNNCLLMLIKYPDEIQALSIYNEFSSQHFPSSNIFQIVSSGTNYYKGCMLTNNIISFVFNSTKEKHIQEIFKNLYKNIRKDE